MSDELALTTGTPEPLVKVEMPGSADKPVSIKSTQDSRIESVGKLIADSFPKASQLVLSDKEDKALAVPFADDEVEIRPHDGLIYLPHISISRRLSEVLGRGQWAMIRQWERLDGNKLYASWMLLVRGCFVGDSVGCCEYYPSNPKQNYSDVLEATRGECLRRIAGKVLSCGDQVWVPSYARNWVDKYAEQAWVRGKQVWRRKGVSASHSDDNLDYSSPPAPQAAPKPVPAQPDVKILEGVGISHVGEKSGETNGKKWTAFLITFDDPEHTTAGTFNTSVAEFCKSTLPGDKFTATLKPGKKAGYWELVDINPSEANEPKDIIP